MKTKWFIIPVIALSLSCNREIETNVTHIDGEFTLYASSGENETKTVLQQDGRVFWSPSDRITVFYGNIPGTFTSTNTEPAASAEFTGTLGSFTLDGETEFKAIYPHSDDFVMPGDNGILSIYLPSEQTAVEGTFADDLFICVAKSKDVNLHFYNVCGGVKFSLARDDIKKVVFKGNNGETLAGRMAVEFASDGIPQVTSMTGGKSSVALTAPDGGTFKAGSWYYLVLVPQLLSKGYTMELWTDELAETVSSDSSVTVRRSAWGVLKNLGAESPVQVDGAVDLGLPSGLLWATCNLGASRPEEMGDLYAWGEIETKEEFTWENYKWCEGDGNSLTKYGGSNGFDGKSILDVEDDAAYMLLGGEWLIPTYRDYNELINNCTWTWRTRSGVNGYEVRGPNGNSIFLPTSYGLSSDYANYGTSELYIYGPDLSYCLLLHGAYDDVPESYSLFFFFYRYEGRSIRPIHFIPMYRVSIAEDEVEVNNYKESETLHAEVIPDNVTNKQYHWEMDDYIVDFKTDGETCSVSYLGRNGSATITFSGDDGRTSTKTDQCKVVSKTYITYALFVNPADNSRLSSLEIIPGESYSLRPSYLPENASEYLTPFAWKSDDPSIATVSNGKVTGVKSGTTNVSALYKTWNDAVIAATCEVVVSDPEGSHEGFSSDYWD